MDMSSCLASSLEALCEVSVVPDTANAIKHILIISNMNYLKLIHHLVITPI